MVCEVAQPKIHILKDYANGTMDLAGKFYKFKSAPFIASGSLPAKPGIRYYVQTIEFSATQPLSIAAVTVDKVEVTVDRITVAAAQLTMPITPAAVSGVQANGRFEPNVLCDINTSVTVTIACATPFWAIRYAEIEEDGGEYQG